jgi:hypothetical protein
MDLFLTPRFNNAKLGCWGVLFGTDGYIFMLARSLKFKLDVLNCNLIA